MGQPARPRFATAQEALRFYFRAQELIAESRPPGRASGTKGRSREEAAPDVIRDFLGIAVCMRRLGGFEVWLLAELYGPTCFYVRERTLTRVFQAARRRFPGQSTSARALARKHRATIDKLTEEFRRNGLIGVAMQARILREAS
jgi:hypothetical protein